jgi:hypothetical protein
MLLLNLNILMGLLDRLGGNFVSRVGSFLGGKASNLGSKLRGGVYQLGNKIFGGGSTQGKGMFRTAANHFVDQALNSANYYGKKFANSDFVRSRAGALVPELENAADHFTKRLRSGYNGGSDEV